MAADRKGDLAAISAFDLIDGAGQLLLSRASSSWVQEEFCQAPFWSLARDRKVYRAALDSGLREMPECASLFRPAGSREVEVKTKPVS